VAGLLVAALVVAGCSANGTPSVRTATVSLATVTQVVDAPGTVTAKASATLSAPADATVAAVDVDEGRQVTAGQVIMRLRSPQAQAALRQARQAVAQLDASTPAGPAPVAVPALPATGSTTGASASGGTGSGGGPVPGGGAGQAAAGAAQAFAAARAAAQAIEDPQARAATLAAVATAEQQAVAAARTASEQSADAMVALQRQLAALQKQTQAVLDALTTTVAGTSAALQSTLGALTQSQRAQAQAALSAAQATVDALVVIAPIDGVVSFDVSAVPASTSLAALGGLSLPGGVTSPFGGTGAAGKSTAAVTGSLSVGSPVAAGQPLALVTDTSHVGATVDIDETDVLLVRPGVRATMQLDAVPGATYRARVLTVAPTPATSAGGAVVYPARLAIEAGTDASGHQAPDPRPGMNAIVDLVVRQVPDAVSVPVAAVFRDGSRDAVWVVRAGVAHRQAVHLGAEGRERIQVVAGLQVGDVVVVGGAGQVREGQSVG